MPGFRGFGWGLPAAATRPLLFTESLTRKISTMNQTLTPYRPSHLVGSPILFGALQRSATTVAVCVIGVGAAVLALALATVEGWLLWLPLVLVEASAVGLMVAIPGSVAGCWPSAHVASLVSVAAHVTVLGCWAWAGPVFAVQAVSVVVIGGALVAGSRR